MSNIIESYTAIAGYMDAVGMPGASEMAALRDATMKAKAILFRDAKAIDVSATRVVEDMKAAPGKSVPTASGPAVDLVGP